MTTYPGIEQRINTIVDWLDQHNLSSVEEQTLRILKVGEEFGEAAQAWIDYLGQNPRRTESPSIHDVVGELADVCITAMVAIETLGGHPLHVIDQRSRYIIDRILDKAER